MLFPPHAPSLVRRSKPVFLGPGSPRFGKRLVPVFFNRGPVAQWSEQQTHNLLVAGSNPAGPTCNRRPKLHSQPVFGRWRPPILEVAIGRGSVLSTATCVGCRSVGHPLQHGNSAWLGTHLQGMTYPTGQCFSCSCPLRRQRSIPQARKRRKAFLCCLICPRFALCQSVPPTWEWIPRFLFFRLSGIEVVRMI